ncbi:MAG: hypothetical protein SFV81_20230 [Pirellulaceae bacterium]|nr:hypothetical protein [Pirellulaceae bacterium]
MIVDNRMNGASAIEVLNHRFARHVKAAQALSFKDICDHARDIAVELFVNEMVARINAAHEEGLINTAFCLGRIAAMLEKFCEGLEEGNSFFAEGYSLEPNENSKDLDGSLGVFDSPVLADVDRYAETVESAEPPENQGPIPGLVASTMSDFFQKVSKLNVNSPYRIGYVARQMSFMCKELCEPFGEGDLFMRSLAGDFNDEEFIGQLES